VAEGARREIPESGGGRTLVLVPKKRCTGASTREVAATKEVADSETAATVMKVEEVVVVATVIAVAHATVAVTDHQETSAVPLKHPPSLRAPTRICSSLIISSSRRRTSQRRSTSTRSNSASSLAREMIASLP